MDSWLLFALLSTFFAGITAVLAKFGLRELPADAALALRTAVVFGLVAVNFLMWHSPKVFGGLSGRSLVLLVFSGITTALSGIFYYKAIKEGDVALVTSIDRGSIVLTILISALVLREPVTPKLLVGSALMLTGLVVLVWK